MYSLVSAPVIGFDLVRLPGGARTAGVLLRALAMDADDLRVAGTQLRDDEARTAAWLELSAAEPEHREVLRVASSMAFEGAATGDAAAVRGGLALLRTARIGTLEALLRCVRHDVLDWTWRPSADGSVAVQDDDLARGAAVVCDAIAASYAGHLLPTATVRALAGPWTAALRRLPERAPHLGPAAPALEVALARLARLDATDRQRLTQAVERSRTGGGWAAAVHDASWAVHLADRVRPTAAAQLRAVEAVAPLVPLEELAAGTWNVLSGAVQAVAVRDLIGTATAGALLGPWLEALGPLPA